MLGTATHETLHALGVDHQQTRYDRDEHVKINWDAIDGQSFDLFTQNDASKFTSYGVKYDYYSIMHYNAFVCAQLAETLHHRANYLSDGCNRQLDGINGSKKETRLLSEDSWATCGDE